MRDVVGDLTSMNVIRIRVKLWIRKLGVRQFLWIGLATLVLAGLAIQSFMQLRAQYDYFREVSFQELLEARARLDDKLKFAYSGIRTISRLPGLQKMGLHGENVDPDTVQTIQEIYNNLASNIDVSEIYIVPLGFDPDRIDSVTGRLQEPAISFDQIIVGRVGGAGSKHSAPIAETEIFEYRLIADQLKHFASEFPTDPSVDGLKVPVRTGPEVVTCDNTLFDPSKPNDKDRSGVVFSVPFYQKHKRIMGVVSSIMLSSRLASLLPDAQQGLYRLQTPFGVQVERGIRGEDISVMPTDFQAYEGQVQIQLGSQDRMGEAWTLSLEKSPLLFWQAPRTVQTLQTILIEFFILLAFASAWMISSVISRNQKRQLELSLANKEHDLLVQRQLRENDEKLKQAHAQLIQSEKMASLGMIAAGVAHEINNPLSFILANNEALRTYLQSIKNLFKEFEQLESALGEGRVADEILARIRNLKENDDFNYILSDIESLSQESRDGIQRVKEIVQGLKSFSRIDENEVKETHINDCIESALRVTWNELKYKVTLEKNLGRLPTISGYPGALAQVFANLFVNSAQAMEDKGILKISSFDQGAYVEIIVEDTGRGIGAENLKNIFTPFFTTKPTGKGTGLGLSISYGIVQKHGGTIDVESEVNKGTKFTIRIPTSKLTRMAS